MNHWIQQRYQHWRDRFELLSVRERAIIVFAVLAGLYTMWNITVMTPVHKKQQTLITEINKWQSQIKSIDNKITQITQAMTGAGEAGSMLRIKKLKDEIVKINQIKKDITVGFIRPEQMAEVLKGLLKKEPGLKLVRMQSLGVESLFPVADKQGKSGKQNTSVAKQMVAEVKVDPSEKQLMKPEVYKHGIVLEFRGDYVSTVNYLQNLEALPWKFYWDGMAYEVQEYPYAMVTVNVFTLSLDKDWIGV